MLDYPKLHAAAEERHAEYATAAPFPFTFFDDFLPEILIGDVERAIPKPGGDSTWDFYFAKGFEEKWAMSDDAVLPSPVRALIHEFNSGPFIRFLEKLTGIDHLLPDPHLHGGGIHLVKRGGLLQIHSDFNWSEKLAAHRRVNMFLYLNPGWQDAWGGKLELWDAKGANSIQQIAPLNNRLVVFSSRSDTFHGHPYPLECPEGVYRQSIAMYYYTSDRPDGEKRDAHNTIYKGLHF
jgi:2OG-Fe(II) oxygenase superfamily